MYSMRRVKKAMQRVPYLKIINESQWVILRQVNPYLGERKLPDAILGLIGRILMEEKLDVHDYIAVFFDPLRNDTIEIYDALYLYPYTLANHDKDFNIDVISHRDGKRISWSGYGIEVQETGSRIYLIYGMREADVWREAL